MGESAASLSIDEICDAFERAWQSGTAPAIETVLQDYPAVDRMRLAAELIGIEAFRRAKRGDPVHADDYRLRFPDLTNRLPELLSDAVQIAEHGKSGAATEPTYIGVSEQPTVSHGAAAPMPPNLSPPLSGQLLGPYRLVKQLGAGGMGTVWEAVHTHLEKTVALKLLAPQLMSDPALVSRFEREMKAVGKLDHQHLVRAYDAGAENGVHYLAMEYIDGMDLAKYVRERGPLSVKQALHVMQQATEGLAEAHRAQLIHRDIKPANLMLNRKGIVKVMDLGLARLQGSGIAAQEGTLTAAGQILGTPDYMAPEQWDDTHAVDGRCDLYALGCTLFFLLTGSVPYRNQSSLMQKMRAHLTQPMPDLRSERQAALSRTAVTATDSEADLPESLVSIYRRLVEKDPEQRFRNADELLDELRAVAPNTANTASTTTPSAPFVTKPPFTILTDVDVHAASLMRRPKSTSPWTGVLITLATLLTVALGIAVVAALQKPEASSKLITQKSTQDPAPAQAAVSWQGWPVDAPKPAIAPFDAAQAKKHQEEWAEYLKVPVEYTNSVDMKFRLIPPGEFLMGRTLGEVNATAQQISDASSTDAAVNQSRSRRVILTKPFYEGVFEVTQAQYEAVMGAHASHFSASGEGRAAIAEQNTTQHPVEMVTWFDAADFCTRLNQKESLKPTYFRMGETIVPQEGSGYRLPTDAEWEYTCRSGTTHRYWSGDRWSDLQSVAWTNANSSQRTHAVGERGANPWGLFDVCGNVWEWIEDAVEGKADPSDRQSLIHTRSVGSASSDRFLRGGCWLDGESASRFFESGYHRPWKAANRHEYFGFRVTLSVEAVRDALHSQSINSSRKAD